MLKTLLTSLLGLFWSKQENAEIVALTNLDYSAKQVLFSGNITGQNIKNLVAPKSGIVISYLDNSTKFNGIATNEAGSFCSLINYGDMSNGLAANSALWFLLKKGEAFDVHQMISEQTASQIVFIPFVGVS